MRKNNKGFTLAELLAVVAITLILMGVAFVAVQNHQRSMTRLEFDGIAKEIFVAAQNHITSAEGQGYLQDTGFGAQIATEQSDGIYYLVKGDPSTQGVFDLMLPFGAVDETVRSGGSYIIRYQPSSGRILDVFYSFSGKSSMLTISGTQLTTGDYSTLLSSCKGDDKKSAREHFSRGVVGWYGGGDELPKGTRLTAPEIEIHNEDVLWVSISDANVGASLQLIVTGETSDAKKAFDLKSNSDWVVPGLSASPTKVFLDDITSPKLHFAQLQADNGKTFVPGEDLTIEAVAYNNSALTNIAYSGKKSTNSLFADLDQRSTTTAGTLTTEHVAIIEYFRHLENLDIVVSGFDPSKVVKKADGTFETISKAEQVRDLVWMDRANTAPSANPVDFLQAVKSIVGGSLPQSIYDKNGASLTTNGNYYPVSYSVSPSVLDYNGQHHSISNVTVDYTGDAGLFEKLAKDSAVSNLELIDFTIAGTTSAGALAGTATDTTVENVLARNSIDETTKKETLDKNIEASGDAGGLIGNMNGGSIEKSAAALYVQSRNANAGGLIGTVTNGGTVEACYSGGHTFSGAPTSRITKYVENSGTHASVYPARYFDGADQPMYNVNADNGNAGGLIGDAGTATISHSYSTCSATGATAGGFIGTGSGLITNCYCTGLVMRPSDTTNNRGAFTGSSTISTNGISYYFEIINEYKDTNSGYKYLGPLKDVDTDPNVKAFDEDVSTYSSFTGNPQNWATAHPYDSGLTTFYGGKYNLQTVKQLGANVNDTTDPKDFVAKHYGDWPAPEEFIFN